MWLLVWGIVQTVGWSVLLVLDAVGVSAVQTLFRTNTFISQISVWALVLAALAQVAASLAQLTASQSHADVEAVRARLPDTED